MDLVLQGACSLVSAIAYAIAVGYIYGVLLEDDPFNLYPGGYKAIAITWPLSIPLYMLYTAFAFPCRAAFRYARTRTAAKRVPKATAKKVH